MTLKDQKRIIDSILNVSKDISHSITMEYYTEAKLRMAHLEQLIKAISLPIETASGVSRIADALERLAAAQERIAVVKEL